jgi:hypothetical protein
VLIEPLHYSACVRSGGNQGIGRETFADETSERILPAVPFPPDAPEKIREKMKGGLLPRNRPPKISAGYGNGELCAGCDRPIQPEEVEYEFHNGMEVRMHIGWAAVWEAQQRPHDWSRKPA